MKPIILGTAGHIDHGKTVLIKALTGIDTDRLKEEKLRGITIELGFAFLRLPSGGLVGIIDVPGHEKFVHHMVAGASSMDLVALIIAADEGIMPQTREHLEICSLLKVKRGLVVITKIDLVDEEWLSLVEEDIREFIKDTFLEDAPIVKVSAITGEGIPELINTLDTLAREIEPKSSIGLFRLPIDRVFTMKGFGTVVTGTTISGRVKLGEPLMVYPKGKRTKVRGLQVHNRDVEEAIAGQRTAINLQGIEKEEIERGDILAPPDTLIPSYMLDGILEILPSAKRAFKNRTFVRLHLNTAEIMGYAILLDKQEIAPGESGYVQFQLERPTVALPGDRFVIRSYSPIYTLGGGEILNPMPKRHKRMRPPVIRDLEILTRGSKEEIIETHLREAKFKGLKRSELCVLTNTFSEDIDRYLDKLIEKERIYVISSEENRYIHSEFVEKARKEAIGYLKNFHRERPLIQGLKKSELRTKGLPFIDDAFFDFLLKDLGDKICQQRDLVWLKGHKISLTEADKRLKDKVFSTINKAGFSPPTPKELAQRFNVPVEKVREIIGILVNERSLIKIKEDMYCNADLMEDLKERLKRFITEHDGITPSQFKSLINASRKYAIPILEYLDSIKYTIRLGDKRTLRKEKL